MAGFTLRNFVLRHLDRWFEEALQWQPWFAWYPVKLPNQEWRWLRTVERRHDITPDFDLVIEYRDPTPAS